jgi:erythronate-4-phosphate dehydrogenase
MLVIVADDAIPLVHEIFSKVAKIKTLPSTDINQNALKNADILFTRSVTKVNATLLQNTPVKFVGTMTAGVDHLDTAWLNKNHIHYASAKGANAKAVADYVISVIAYLQNKHKLNQKTFRAGVIGAGHAGQLVAHLLKSIGANLLLNDPPRATKDKRFQSTPLSEFTDLDLISIHTPLITNGKSPTVNLIDAELLNQQKKCVLINTSRGGVVDANALFKHNNITACVDVFPDEPNIDPTIIANALLTTPHIAGYSLAAKLRATLMIFDQARQFFNWKEIIDVNAILKQHQTHKTIHDEKATMWADIVLQAYNPFNDSQQLKEKGSASFESLRKNYPLRAEFDTFEVIAPNLNPRDKEILMQLGFLFK